MMQGVKIILQIGVVVAGILILPQWSFAQKSKIASRVVSGQSTSIIAPFNPQTAKRDADSLTIVWGSNVRMIAGDLSASAMRYKVDLYEKKSGDKVDSTKTMTAPVTFKNLKDDQAYQVVVSAIDGDRLIGSAKLNTRTLPVKKSVKSKK